MKIFHNGPPISRKTSLQNPPFLVKSRHASIPFIHAIPDFLRRGGDDDVVRCVGDLGGWCSAACGGMLNRAKSFLLAFVPPFLFFLFRNRLVWFNNVPCRKSVHVDAWQSSGKGLLSLWTSMDAKVQLESQGHFPPVYVCDENGKPLYQLDRGTIANNFPTRISTLSEKDRTLGGPQFSGLRLRLILKWSNITARTSDVKIRIFGQLYCH